MKREIYIYLGTVIFFILAIALGIVMYMLTRTSIKQQDNISRISQEEKIEENQPENEVQPETENVSTEIGKTVDEAQKEETNKTNTTNTNTTPNTPKQTENATNVKEQNVDKTEKTEEVKKQITFAKPAEGEIIGEFAKDNLVYSETLKEWITHTAVDIKTDKTSVIKAAADGIVKTIVNDPRYGLTVIIEHDDGYQTVYSNLLTAEFVVEGEEVKQGQAIGTAGNTAVFESGMECHLHFELMKDNEYVDPTIYIN